MQGYEIPMVLLVIVLLFGGSQLPKLARSLGEAKKEFEKGQSHEAKAEKAEEKAKVERAKAASEDDEV